MKVIRTYTKLKKMTRDDDCYMDTLPQERVSFMWELTEELWSLWRESDVKPRLQRDIVCLIKK